MPRTPAPLPSRSSPPTSPPTWPRSEPLHDALPLVAAAEARATGIRTPLLHRVRHGVYADRAAWTVAPAWVRYRTRIAAYLLINPAAVLCLESAAAAHGLPLFDEPREIHVFDAARSSSRRFGDIVVHTARRPPAVVDLGGVLATSVADTVVDLVRALPPAQALAVADGALSPRQRTHPLSLDDLVAGSARRPTRRGSVREAWVWERADALAESVAESLSRAVIEWCGFERPQLQREFRIDGHRDRADFFFPSSGAIGEADGWGKYDLHDPAAAARHLTAEKRREDRLRRAGHPVARWDYAGAVRIAPLRDALQQAGVARVARPSPAYLATLSDRRRSL